MGELMKIVCFKAPKFLSKLIKIFLRKKVIS